MKENNLKALFFGQWQFITRLRSGHRLFINQEKQYHIADDSGYTPDETEDGPLYIDTSRPIVLTTGLAEDEKPDNTPFLFVASIPVLLSDKEKGDVWVMPEDGYTIAKFTGMQPRISKEVQKFLEDSRFDWWLSAPSSIEK